MHAVVPGAGADRHCGVVRGVGGHIRRLKIPAAARGSVRVGCVSVERIFGAAVPMIGTAEALSALGAALLVRSGAADPDPPLAAALGSVVDALGLRDAVDELDEQQAAACAGMVEGLLAQSAHFARDPERAGWSHEDQSVLMGQGLMSGFLAGAFKHAVVPSMDAGLDDRLGAPGAAMLDVGTGVAALAVAFCRTWPELRVVGVDPWEPALALAREQVAQAGMGERIELRRTTAEQLDDDGAYDLAWVPTFFIDPAVLDQAAARVLTALRPGGWAVFGQWARPEDPMRAALSDLRTVRQGGAVYPPAETVERLTLAGYADAGVHFDTRWGSPVLFVCGRRPEAAA